MSISLSLIATVFTLASPSPMFTESATMASAYVQLPKGHVAVLDRECPDYPAGSGVSCVYHAKPDVIYTNQNDSWIFLHELGHVFDMTKTMKPWQRTAFRLIMKDRTSTWYTYEGGETGLSEKFADAYADCAQGFQGDEANFPGGAYGYHPTKLQQFQVCRMLAPRR